VQGQTRLSASQGGAGDPEELARKDINRQVARCGWQVQNRDETNLSAGLGIAVREFPMLTGEADYLLYSGGMALGVVEAKPAAGR
jgi:type I restriction enzyme R subunit